MIEYEWIDARRTAVFLDGKRVGKIIPGPHGGWQYHPKGGSPGEVFLTIEDCKKSLEEE